MVNVLRQIQHQYWEPQKFISLGKAPSQWVCSAFLLSFCFSLAMYAEFGTKTNIFIHSASIKLFYHIHRYQSKLALLSQPSLFYTRFLVLITPFTEIKNLSIASVLQYDPFISTEESLCGKCRSGLSKGIVWSCSHTGCTGRGMTTRAGKCRRASVFASLGVSDRNNVRRAPEISQADM